MDMLFARGYGVDTFTWGRPNRVYEFVGRKAVSSGVGGDIEANLKELGYGG
jgi:hypothetical protein